MNLLDLDVAIVGCGPVGALAANLLGQYGLSVGVFERETTAHGQPRAFSCDDEAIRIFQAAGLSELLVRDMMQSKLVDYTGADGQIFAQLALEGLDFGNGHHPLNFFHQPLLEAGLRNGLARYPSVFLKLGAEVTALEQDALGVNLSVREAGKADPYPVRARYVLACDGAHSTVRRLTGIGMNGQNYHEQWLAVTCDSPEDAVRVRNACAFVCNPSRPTFFARGCGKQVRVELMLHPDESVEALEKPAKVAELIAPYVEPSRVQITRAAVYRFQHAIADHWQLKRVFLVGDAAHLMPPFMGQGMCSGLRDAANLSWKLALVLKGQAQPRILHSYEVERRPHASLMAKASVYMGYIFLARSLLVARLRDRFFAWLDRIPKVRAFIRSFGFKPPPLIDQGLIAGGHRANRTAAEGRYFPQPRVRIAGGQEVLFDEVLGNGFALVSPDLSPDVAGSPAWKDLGARFVRVLPAGTQPRPSPPGSNVVEVEDPRGIIPAWFQRHKVRAALIRPDRFVFAGGFPAELGEELQRALRGE